MAKPKRRTYDSSGRKAAAAATRRSIIEAATHIFMDLGYAGATMVMIAAEAGIALDTVYAVVGKKPELFRLLVETALSGGDKATPGAERDYARAIRGEPEAASKIRIYAAAVREIQPRLAPIFKVLQAAATQDHDLNALWQEISSRRATNMRLLAENLMATGRTRRGLSADKIADILWSLNSPEFFLLLVEQRKWSLDEFERFLDETWVTLLLDPS